WFDDPVSGQILSLPDHGEPTLNRLYLRAGRMPDTRRSDEVVLIGSFAQAHQLVPGDSLAAIIQGRWQTLRIVGIAESPEFIYVIPPGSMLPDYQRYAILWMAQRPLAAATDMVGAFNSVLVALQPGAGDARVIDQLDRLFRPYGSTGAYARADQFSNRFLTEELKQLRTMAILFPTIFMSVAVFLINVVIGRLVATQRDVIAVLKAFGYSNWQVSGHFARLVMLIMLLGVLLGVAAGLWLGSAMSRMYMDYFRFPALLFSVPLGLVLLVVMLTIAAGLLGAYGALSRAFRLPPAQALGPEPPPRYRRTLLECGLSLMAFSQLNRMILRSLARRPLRSVMSVLGIAMATAIVVLGTFQFDSVNLMVHAQFARVQQEDMTVSLVHPRTGLAVNEVLRIPGVRAAEATLAVPVRIHAGHRQWRTSLVGSLPDARLTRRVDASLVPVAIPAQGVMLTALLMDKLALRPGDKVAIEWLDGSGERATTIVAGGTQEFIGIGAWMALPALQALRGRGAEVNHLQLSVEPGLRQSVLAELDRRPLVAGVSERQAMLDAFYQTLGRTFLTFTLVNSLLGGVIAFGVVYNTVRISLAERGRELASLRVLGYRPTEVDHILLGELAILLLVAIPLGWLVGQYLAMLLIWLMQSELYRVPLLITPRTLGLSATVVVLSAVLSAAIAARRIATLDLVAVLKTRE
ncbi:MAG TPA: ABC transporter permease, partial [Kineobactrum sp.]